MTEQEMTEWAEAVIRKSAAMEVEGAATGVAEEMRRAGWTVLPEDVGASAFGSSSRTGVEILWSSAFVMGKLSPVELYFVAEISPPEDLNLPPWWGCPGDRSVYVQGRCPTPEEANTLLNKHGISLEDARDTNLLERAVVLD